MSILQIMRDTLEETAEQLVQIENGNYHAVDRVLKIMERRAKLLGLDAPAKVTQTTVDGKDIEDRIVVYVLDNGRG